MSAPWLCSSCRRRLLCPSSTRQRGPASQRALFASHSSVTHQGKKLHDDFFVRLRTRKRTASRVLPFKLDRVVEDDFVDRIAANHDPASGPYSSSRSDTEAHRPLPTKSVSTPSPSPTPNAKPISLRYLRSQLPLSPSAVADSLGLSSKDARPSSNIGFYSSALAALAQDANVTAESPQPQLYALPTNHQPISGTKDALSPTLPKGVPSEEEAPLTFDDALANWSALTSDTEPNTAASPKTLRLAVCKLLASRWCESSQHAGPTPVDLVQWAVKNQVHPRHLLILWRECLWTVLLATSQPEPPRSLADMTTQINGLWSALLRGYGECNVRAANGNIQLVHGTADWVSFADSEQMRQIRTGSVRQLSYRLASFFSDPINGLLTKRSGHDSELAALASLVYIQPAIASSAKTTSESATATRSFVGFLKGLVAHSNMMDMLPIYSKILDRRGFAQPSRNALLREISDAASNSLEGSATVEVHSNAGHGNRGEPPSAVRATDWNELYKKRLGRALEARNLVHLNQLWNEIKRVAEPSGHANSTGQHVSSVLYAHAMTAFMALDQPPRAVEVWNTMTAAGVAPSIEHWDAMLKGCGISRDGHAVHDLWVKMLAAGTRPDARAWATRIHSLTSCGHAGAAMAAFESMAQQWRDAVLGQSVPSTRASRPKPQPDYLPPKPNTQCLNAVIAGLARARRDDYLSRALTLARELDIQLDTYTFNPLFRSALRDGNEPLAARLLQRMQHMGIKPDIATFTIMLGSALEGNGTFDLAAITSDPQISTVDTIATSVTATEATAEHETGERGNQHAVKTLFALMEEADIRPTAHTFSTLVAGLLKGEPPHVTAAYAVLRHVTERDLPLSPQIYTALTSFHFEQNPPDLTSVEALWHHARSQRSRTHPLTLDGFFYDRFIDGWAWFGYTARALQAHQTAKRHGVQVGWGPLKRLVSKLVENGSREEAQAVTKDAMLDYGKENGQSRGCIEFMELSRDLGLEV